MLNVLLRVSIIVFFHLVLTGCAVTYKMPTASYEPIKENISGSHEDLFNTSIKVLYSEGYQIIHSDIHTGTITTAKRNIKLSAQECDCGTTLGLPYIKDTRTQTQISLCLAIENNLIVVNADITGNYNVGKIEQDRPLTCVSTGLIERGILQKVQDKLKVQ
ncbi:MAG TPA: hypothetical protein PLU81_16645 [Deltaproteobacteria bacterium]|nr:hypothetical protein [Deltaproteobacteria bacterium]